MTVKKVLKKIIRNGIEYEFPTNGGGGGGSDLDIGGVSAIVDMKLGDYDSLFSITSGLYKILNAIDTDDEIGLTSGESWSQIVSSATSMSKISHCYAVMCYIANSSVAMNQIVGNSSATKEISECWNSITIIAENQLSSDIYLGSVNGLTYLFAYTTAQDAFFTSTERKTEIISDNIMVIVNNNTLLTNINDDPVVEAVIASSEEAMLAIVASTAKLDIVDENSVIMTGIATNASALTAMSDQNFTSYILEDHDYLVACTSDDDGKARINSMAADDLLPAIFYWTGLSGYSTFADLAANDSAMEIVQSNTESMLIIESNTEAAGYLGYTPNEHTVAYFPLVDNVTDTVAGMTLTASGTQETLGRTFTSYVDYSNETEFKKTKFISVRMRMNSGLGGSSCCTQLFDVGDAPISYCMSHSQAQFRNSVHAQDTSNNRPYINTGMVEGTRYLFCAGIDGNTAYYWKNGVKQTITNSCKTSGGGAELIRMAGNAVSITLSDLICEDRVPTDEDITKYYDLVKKKYGYT